MLIIGPDVEASGLFVRLHPVGTKAKGWGYEPDTVAAMHWLEEKVKPGMTVCDIGTGTGILALVAARLGAVVTAYEERDAVRHIAAENFALNEVHIVLGAEYDGADGFDLVVANLGGSKYRPIDYEGLGILKSGKEVWMTPWPNDQK